ncbi:hypothetical protein OG523_03935 [Streptomyces virginiae]|uniref:hypothetical protein n=1 Tax=Streptomyces virginiae TaxID=1961 RepID=UPI002E38027A|nr:hypothetical protein [Streptomyces virginiae]
MSTRTHRRPVPVVGPDVPRGHEGAQVGGHAQRRRRAATGQEFVSRRPRNAVEADVRLHLHRLEERRSPNPTEALPEL